jgi:GTPase SAR1 family protein
MNLNGKRAVKRIKVMVVGEGEAGKTTLIRRLFKDEYTGLNERTDGVEINRMELEGIDYNFWDFGGQHVYLNSHSLFFSRRTIFLIVINPVTINATSQEGNSYILKSEEIIRRELNLYYSTIQAHAPKSPVMIILTHGDILVSIPNIGNGGGHLDKVFESFIFKYIEELDGNTSISNKRISKVTNASIDDSDEDGKALDGNTNKNNEEMSEDTDASIDDNYEDLSSDTHVQYLSIDSKCRTGFEDFKHLLSKTAKSQEYLRH